jgi:hypothetical protein
MHVERVDAHAFGPLQGDALDLGPGCNVIHGPNESGKSSWHAALTTALSGRRRGRGGQTTAEREFAERHRPWSGGRWQVGAHIRLADGRAVRVFHDLDEPGRCQADDERGRAVLDEILVDGMPDPSRWLGLDRDAFRACASVGQADVARVGAGAGALQHYLQQAASTRKAESTAGAALTVLRSFKSEAVGADRKNAVKPLRRASTRLAAAASSLTAAEAAHANLIAATEAGERLAAAAARATLERRAAEAIEADGRAAELDRRVERVAELTARCPEPPPPLDRDDEQARAVAAGLGRWDERPPVPDPPSPATDELRALLAEPLPVFGDTEVHAIVDDALRAAHRAHDGLDLHRGVEPPPQVLPDGTEPVELRELARRLRDEPAPAPAPPPPTAPASVPVLVGAGALAAGVALAVAGLVIVAVLVVAAGLGVAAALRSRRPTAAPQPPPVPTSPVGARITGLGLPTDPDRLDLLADRADAHRSWVDEGRRRRDEARRTKAVAVQATASRLGVDVAADTSLTQLLATYREACRRAATAKQTALEERNRLETELVRAQAVEERRQQALAAGQAARQALEAAGAAIGASRADEEGLAAGLRAWEAARTDRLEAMELRQQDWTELQRAGGGKPLAVWYAALADARRRAAELAAGIDPEALARVRAEGLPLAEHVVAERRALDRAHQAAATLEVQQANAPSVAEATEVAAAATAELGRVRDLDRVLTTTITCLEQAQDRLYRSLAPVLADRLGQVLPRITTGRYDEVTVDPETLAVRVRLADGTLQAADHLSHGTAEQLYLLLRVAMAERLAGGAESCPLLLDDVTVHCDPVRTEAILDLLARVTEDRQVVLFTQEPEVVAWAERTLAGDRHRVIALDRPAVPA